MRKYALFFVLILTSLYGCAQRTDLDNKLSSPSGKYQISASVNHSKDDPRKYLCLKLFLFDSSGNLLKAEQTGVSDTMKWALGWMDKEDVVVLYSSDIGTSAYDVKLDGLHIISELTPLIESRAVELKSEKYKSATK